MQVKHDTRCKVISGAKAGSAVFYYIITDQTFLTFKLFNIEAHSRHNIRVLK